MDGADKKKLKSFSPLAARSSKGGGRERRAREICCVPETGGERRRGIAQNGGRGEWQKSEDGRISSASVGGGANCCS